MHVNIYIYLYERIKVGSASFFLIFLVPNKKTTNKVDDNGNSNGDDHCVLLSFVVALF